MKKSLQLTIETGYSLNQNFESPYWKFIIGMPLNQALDIISNQNGDYMKRVDFLHSSKLPTHMDIVVTLFNEGIKLHFDPKYQRLKIIEIYHFGSVSFYYCNNKFNEVPELPTKERIIQVFGFAKAPDFDALRKSYQISYRGLSFTLSHVNNSVANDQQFIYSLTNINQLVASAAFIFDGKSFSDPDIPKELPIECFLGNVLLEELVINRDNCCTQSLDFHMILVEKSCNDSAFKTFSNGVNRMDNIVRINRSVKFGDCVQEVITALGGPNRIYFKTEDKMKIHSLKSQKDKMESKIQTRKFDYFYNYLTLGVDIMFRYEDNTVSKFILHTNFPDEYLFNTYYRCNFTMDMERDQSTSKFQVSTFTKWSLIQSQVSSRYDPVPVEISRFVDQCHKSGVESQTMAYGVDDLIFEIMPENDHIASLTIYEVDESLFET